MAVYHAESLLFGPFAERPELSDPTIYSPSGIALFLAVDTGDLWETSGSTWALLGTLSLPGVTSDGTTVTVMPNFYVGDPSATTEETIEAFYGSFNVYDTPANLVTGDSPFFVSQAHTPGATGNGEPAVYVIRSGSVAAGDYAAAIIYVRDYSGSAQPQMELIGTHTFTVKNGMIGLHDTTPPAAPRTLAQSAIDAMTDTNAKTAVQAVANALADMGALTLT